VQLQQLERGFSTQFSGANQERLKEQEKREKAKSDLEKRRAQLTRLNKKGEARKPADEGRPLVRKQWNEADSKVCFVESISGGVKRGRGCRCIVAALCLVSLVASSSFQLLTLHVSP